MYPSILGYLGRYCFCFLGEKLFLPYFSTPRGTKGIIFCFGAGQKKKFPGWGGAVKLGAFSGRGGAVLKIFRAGLGQPFFLGLGQGGACIPDFSNHKGVTVLNCITKKVAYCILRQFTILQNIALPFSARLDVTNCAHWGNNFSFLAQTFRNSLQEQVQEEGAGAGGAIIQEI